MITLTGRDTRCLFDKIMTICVCNLLLLEDTLIMSAWRDSNISSISYNGQDVKV